MKQQTVHNVPAAMKIRIRNQIHTNEFQSLQKMQPVMITAAAQPFPAQNSCEQDPRTIGPAAAAAAATAAAAAAGRVPASPDITDLINERNQMKRSFRTMKVTEM